MICIMGTEYEIITESREQEEAYTKNTWIGFCDFYAKEIHLLDLKNDENYKNESDKCLLELSKKVLRHEITHAFMYESGLESSAHTHDGPWSLNEEMVDWIAIQSPKIFEAFKQVGCL